MSWISVALESQTLDSGGAGSQVFRLHAAIGTEDVTTAFFASGPQNDEGTLPILDLPQEGEYYEGLLVQLQNSSVTKVGIARNGDNENIYTATVTYGDGGGGDDTSDDRDKDPWDREATISVNGTFVSVDSSVDVKGKALTNSLGDPIWNLAPINAPSIDISISRSRKYSDSAMLNRILLYNGKINSAAYTLLGQSFPELTLLATLTGQKQWHSSGGSSPKSYWAETISFKYHPRTFVGKYLDEGFRGKVNETDEIMNFPTPIKWDGTKIVWDFKQPANGPFTLNGNGKLLTALGQARNGKEANADSDLPEVDLALSTAKAVMLNRYEYLESDFQGLI